jgi:hypothetical protein
MATKTIPAYPLATLDQAMTVLARLYGLRGWENSGLYVHGGVATLYNERHGDVEIVARVAHGPAGRPGAGRAIPDAVHDLVAVQPQTWLEDAQAFVDNPPAVVYGGQNWTRYASGEARFPYDFLMAGGDRTLEWPAPAGRLFVVIVRGGQVVALVRDRVRNGVAD